MIKLGIVLLAAGKSSRFGSNKLLADFGGKPMITRALEAASPLPAARRVAVTGGEAVEALALSYGYDVVRNECPELGQARSVCMGVAHMQGMDAALLMVGDQPLLTSNSLSALLKAFSESGKGIACLRDETHMGNPAIFSKAYFSELLALSGDRGAKGILCTHAEDLIAVDCTSPMELLDADEPQTLKALLEA